MKYALIAVIIGLAAIGYWKVTSTKAPESIPQVSVSEVTGSTTAPVSGTAAKVTSATFSFTGYGPGKEHTGTFKKVTHSLLVDSKGLVSSGTVTIDTSSVDTGIEGLDNHLKNEDFFDVTVYPTATFTLEGMTWASGTSATASGTLDFHGVKKAISFPVAYDAAAKTYSADLRIKASDFALKYTAIKDEVRLQFSVSL